MSEKQSAPTVDVNTLCKLFNLTPMRIGQLVKEGAVTKAERGKYDLWESVKGYIRFLQERKHNQHLQDGDEEAENYTTARARKLRAEADLKEIQRDAERNRYVTRESQLAIGHQAGLLNRAEWQKLASELPPLIAGMESGPMAATLEDYGWNKAEHIAKAFGELGVTDGRGTGGGMPTPKAATPKRVGRKKRPSAK